MFSEFSDYSDCEPIGAALPRIEIDKKYYAQLDLPETSTNSEFLRKLVRQNILKKGIDKKEDKARYYEQAKYEIEVFEETGLVDYLLALWDIVNFANENGINMSPARGSAASSLVLFIIGVTKVDPVKYDLIFERFVSRTRIKKVGEVDGVVYFDGSLLADVDLDFDYSRRQEVISYIENKYSGRTAKILTFNTFSSKLCIKEAVKYFNDANEEEAGAVSDLIQKKHGVVQSIAEALEDNEKFQEWAKFNKNVVEQARKIEDLNKNSGLHPSGICVSYGEIDSICPLQLSKDGDLVTAYEMNDVADLMVKFDILGLRTITIANKACEKAGINIDDIDPEDPFIYEVLQDFKNPCGLFQISASTNSLVCQDVKPVNLMELSDVIGLARPGALSFVGEYIKQKRSPQKMGLNDKLDEILAKSKNVLLFQEQGMRAIHEVFGLPKEDAETIRKIIGKKQRDKMPAWKDKIFNAAKENGVDEIVAEYFWKAMEASANYQFNLSHSVSYSVLASKTIYLKWKYPKEFFCSILDTANFDPDPLQVIADVSKEVSDFGIKILSPNLEKSSMDFLIEGNNIRYGLSSIKGISQNTLKALEDFAAINPKNKYEVFTAAKSVGINIGVLTSLIYAGCLGERNRSKTVLEAQAFNLLTGKGEQRNVMLLGPKYDYDLLNTISDIVEKGTVGDDGKTIMKPSRFETFKKKFEPFKQMFMENKKHEKLSIWWFEKQLLGYSFSFKLKECFQEIYELNDLKDVEDNKLSSWRAVVIVDDFFTKMSKNGNRYMTLIVSDDYATRRLMFCDSQKEKKLTNFEDSVKLKKGQILVVKATRGNGGSDFVDNIKVMSDKVMMKTRDLK